LRATYATLVGDLVSDRYRIVGEVGRTSFGVLYTAEDTQSPGLSVAINVLLGEMPALASDRRAFEQETEDLARRADIDLTHTITAGRLPDGRPYWLMACAAIMPQLVTAHDVAPQPTSAAATAHAGPRLERYEYVPFYRRPGFALAFYALPVLLAVIGTIVARMSTEEARPAPKGFDRHLVYTVRAQRYFSDIPVGDAYPVELPRAFGPGERIQLEVSTPEEGYLYVVHEGALPTNGIPHYDIVHPTRGRHEQAAYIQGQAGRRIPSEGHISFTAEDETADKLWFVWSSSPLDQFSGLTAGDKLDTAQIHAIQDLLRRRAATPVNARQDASSQRVFVDSTSDPWIHLLSLSRQ